MTIAAGFVCTDGVLLASDTLYSGYQNALGEKLWVLHDDDPVVVFGGASSSVATLTRARDEIQRKIKKGDSFQRTLDTIDVALEKVNQKFSPPPNPPDVQAIAVIRKDGHNALYQNVSGKVALSPVDLRFACVGVEALGMYFAEFLFRPQMTMRMARLVAAHLIANCKKYASGFCGGETRLIEIPDEGPVTRIDDQVQIRALEDHLAGLDRAYMAVLPDGNVDEATLKHRVWQITNAISQAERGFVIQAVAASVSVVAGVPSVVITSPVLPPTPVGPTSSSSVQGGSERPPSIAGVTRSA